MNLEGINFTLPEIQTLLDGITVGGHKVTDRQIALNQAETWRILFDLIENNQFAVTIKMVCDLHRTNTRYEIWKTLKSLIQSGQVNVVPPDHEPARFFRHAWPLSTNGFLLGLSSQ